MLARWPENTLDKSSVVVAHVLETTHLHSGLYAKVVHEKIVHLKIKVCPGSFKINELIDQSLINMKNK